MNQSLKRILNAFGLGFVTALLTLALVSWTDITNAVTVGDWMSLRNIGIALLFGAINAGLRALQTGPVPSPEPEENA